MYKCQITEKCFIDFKTGLECDAVIYLRNGNYGLIEIKLGGENAIEHGAETLKTLANKINACEINRRGGSML